MHKYQQTKKNDNNDKNKCRNYDKTMVRTKAATKRLPNFIPLTGKRIENKNILNRRPTNPAFKLKKTLPQTLQLEAKKNGEVIRKSHYFS